MQGKYFSTVAERRDWILQDFRKMLSYIIERNARGAYDATKARFPEFENWAPGALNGAQKERLFDYLEQQALNSGEADKFITDLAAAVPVDPRTEGLWLKS